MVCDHQSGIPLALLPNRLPETITTWLKNYPFVQVVSRDGFTAFRQAITQADPSIKQVYDRWHFIRNAKKQIDTHLTTLVPSSIVWTDSTVEETMIPLTKQERTTSERQKAKWLLIQEVQKEFKSGKTIAELSRQYQVDWRTIKKYVNLKASPTHHRTRAKPIDLYLDEVIRLEQAGQTVKSIYHSIHKKGYRGTYSAVRTLV